MDRFSAKHMPKFYGSVSSNDAVAIAMQMAKHGDLLDHLNSNGPLSEFATGIVFGQLFRVVDAAHKSGISHRDIKLENVRDLALPAKNPLIDLEQFSDIPVDLN